ncbi:hypothetical protein NCCP2222_12850 [Sporosarcina sp. NCCP-2222]|uniref:hypothetical protein n=1 Tax=Sporosarcina sp. NCCP-2222 TaxID=2935073 RepID=UPI00208176A8|nr:hypothetical protein [Sporosarcina sp. NCCP-2222]GKV55338.1 hypothetical protein NCCP2222_12850 [Sporosarcina sp. NCCP-2222]
MTQYPNSTPPSNEKPAKDYIKNEFTNAPGFGVGVLTVENFHASSNPPPTYSCKGSQLCCAVCGSSQAKQV